MLFTLEALNARFGDSLLLHYGTLKSPKLIVIDGGPGNVYVNQLSPRLEALRKSRVREGQPLPIHMVMVSHVDADHIKGILDLTNDLIDADESGNDRSLSVNTIWHNSFDDLVKKVKLADFSGAAQSLKLAAAGGQLPSHVRPHLQPDSALVLASIDQGRKLRSNADKLGIPLNQGFTDLIVAPDDKKHSMKVGTNLRFTIVGPRQDQLDALQKQWAKTIAARRKKGNLKPAEVEAIAAAFVDKSVYNLSSIVVLAESGGKSMLLTGDARGDYVLEGLVACGLKTETNKLEVNLLKVPHHGSVRNLAPEFFEQVVADHYIFSADGTYENPDLATVKMLFDVRGNEAYTLHFTNHTPWIDKLLKKSKPSGVEVCYAEENDGVSALSVDLGESMP